MQVRASAKATEGAAAADMTEVEVKEAEVVDARLRANERCERECKEEE